MVQQDALIVCKGCYGIVFASLNQVLVSLATQKSENAVLNWSYGSVLTANFSDHSHRAMAQHLPDPLHGDEVRVQLPLPVLLDSRSGSSSHVAGRVAPLRRFHPAQASGAWQASAGWHGEAMAMRGQSPSADPGQERWPLLPRAGLTGSSPLLVIVHGHSDGVVPQVLISLLDALERQRQAPVWVQALTADRLELPPAQEMLMVPLLLTPGSHVRSDVPVLRQHFLVQGHGVTLLPFLGSWVPWLQHLQQLARESGCSVVLHHPLRAGVADRYLSMLSRAIGLPLLSADQAPEELDRALPLALAPNRMTAHLRACEGGGLALLEQTATRQFLLDLLLALP